MPSWDEMRGLGNVDITVSDVNITTTGFDVKRTQRTPRASLVYYIPHLPLSLPSTSISLFLPTTASTT